jgi:hypothetical protein
MVALAVTRDHYPDCRDRCRARGHHSGYHIEGCVCVDITETFPVEE